MKKNSFLSFYFVDFAIRRSRRPVTLRIMPRLSLPTLSTSISADSNWPRRRYVSPFLFLFFSFVFFFHFFLCLADAWAFMNGSKGPLLKLA